MISIQLIKDSVHLETIRGEWESLHAAASCGNTFNSPDWLICWWQAYGGDSRLVFIVASIDGRMVGVAPLMIRTVSWAGASFEQLMFVGDGSEDSDHLCILTTDESRGEILDAMLCAAHGQLRWDVAVFNRMTMSDADRQTIDSWCRKFSLLKRSERVNSPICRLPGSYDAFLSRIQPRFRSKLRSIRKRAHEQHQVDFGMHGEAANLQEALDTLYTIHRSRWNLRGEHGAFADPRRRRFYELVAPRLLERGELRFYYLKFDGEIVAQQFCFESRGNVFQLQEGFRSDRSADHVGHLLRSHVIESLIATKAHTYDFLAQSTWNKELWSDGKAVDWRVVVAKRGVREALFVYAPPLREAASTAVRRFVPDKYIRSLKSTLGLGRKG